MVVDVRSISFCFLLSFFGCVLLVLSGGCGSDLECRQNSDCKATQVCEESQCKEVQSGCSADAECNDKQVCKNGVCQAKTSTPGCKDDKECKGGEVCNSGKCERPIEPNPCDPACKAGENCVKGKCVKPSDGTCKVDADCNSGETCLGEKVCVKKFLPCTKNGDCEATELCAEVTTGKNACLLKCDPSQNKSDNSNEACWKAWGWCQKISQSNPNLGVCIPPQEKTRKKGETCNNLSDFSKPEYNECVEGLNCVRGKCAPNCKESDGKAANPLCEKGFYCKESNGKGICEALPKKEIGGGTVGQQCSRGRTCDGDKGFFCNVNVCLTACDPRDGKSNNPKCKQGEICQDNSERSFLGGGCTVPPTQKQDEACNNASKLCVEGLTCSRGRCQTSCSKTEDCGKEEVCLTTSGVCVGKCDPTQAPSGGNPSCKVGYSCVASQTVTPGYCRALPTFTEGTGKLGDACSSQTSPCDGSKGLYCSSRTCRKACDQRKGTSSNTTCASTQECANSSTSPLGGVCLNKATQKEGEACNATTLRCVNNLTCRSSRCQRTCSPTQTDPQGGCKASEWCYRATQTVRICLPKCDPSKGVVGNASCSATYFCAANTTTYKPGFCAPLPAVQQGTKKLGEACSRTSASLFCDGKSGLTCVAGECVTACNPADGTKTNPACGTSGTCELSTQDSPKGGVCIPTPSQKENEECNRVNRCLKALVCVNLGSRSYCQTECDPKNSKCPSGSTCQTIPQSQSSYCATARKNVRKEHEVCQGKPGTPAYDSCVSGYQCLSSPGSDSHCLKTCTASSQCGSGFSCSRLSRNSRVCTQNCKVTTDCKAYGGTCRTIGSASYCY